MADDDSQFPYRCSLSNFHSDICNFYTRYKNEKGLITLKECRKDIYNHMKSVKISVGGNRGLNAGKIADVNDEADLICRRVGLFSTNYDLTVCPYHRFKLGIDFWQGKNCKHPKHTGNGKVFRGISSYQSQRILEKFAVLVPIGSGMNFLSYSHGT